MMQEGKNSFLTTRTVVFDEPIALEAGVILPNYQLMIETYGQLNSKGTNAVLICPALSGNHHVAGRYHKEDQYPGWWNSMVGVDKPIDTQRFFVVGITNLGGYSGKSAGCAGSTSPSSVNPDTGRHYGPDFPLVGVEDWVKTQARLADTLKIKQWAAVVGGSLGGMQALEWAVDYPNRLRRAVIIASAPKLSAQNIAFNDVARQAILSDPEFYGGHYALHQAKPRRGLKIARMMGHITYLAEYGLTSKFGRGTILKNRSYTYESEFEVESYLRYQGDKFAEFFDANTYLLMTKALDYFDPAEKHGSLRQAVSRIRAQILLISFTSDWRFAPSRSKEILHALTQEGKAVQYLEVDSEHGHDAFLMQDPAYIEAMRIYFNRLFTEIDHESAA